MLQKIQPKTTKSVAAVLERELDSIISEWKRRASLVPSLTTIMLSDADRTAHCLDCLTGCLAAYEVIGILNPQFLSPQPRMED
jgi:hypothetical protein